MLRTDHCYPPTAHAPLHPTVADHHFEALTMPAPLPPTIEPLTPTPEVTFTEDEAEALWQMQARAHARIATERELLAARERRAQLPPPSRVPWFGLVVSVALFAVGYLMGRFL